MTSPRRSRAGRPWRRLRRWMRYTPSQTIAVTVIGFGVLLVLIALVVVVLA